MSQESKDFLKKQGLGNPPIDSGISGGGDAPRVYVSDIMEKWASIVNKELFKKIHQLEKKIFLLEKK